MKKLLPSGWLRIIYLLVAFGVQLFTIIMVLLFFRSQFAYFQLFSTLLSLLVVIHIIKEDTNPTFKIPWIVLNLTLPLLGGLAYLFYGNIRFLSRERWFVEEVSKRHRTLLPPSLDNIDELRAIDPHAAIQSMYLATRANAPLYKGTSTAFYPSGEQFWEALLIDLQKAERFIFLEYFIIRPGKMWDAIEKILIEKAASGVEVRLLYDYFGCLLTLPAGFALRLEGLGIKVSAFNRKAIFFDARFNHRDHRKITVIDGNIGYTGGINLADEYINAEIRFGHWKDTAIRLEGEAVKSLSAQFLALWTLERGEDDEVLPYAPSIRCADDGFVQPFDDEPIAGDRVGETAYKNLITRAVDYVYIMSPYLIIDNDMIRTMTDTAKSGVDVRILMPAIPDKPLVGILNRSYYQVLLKGGVRIFEYTPGFVHAKQFVSDDKIALVGTINLDYRSLVHHFENGVWMYDTSSVLPIRDDFLSTLEQSEEITLESLRRRGLLYHVLLSILRLFAPLM